MAARVAAGLEHGDLVLAMQQVRGHEARDPGTDDRDLHRGGLLEGFLIAPYFVPDGSPDHRTFDDVHRRRSRT